MKDAVRYGALSFAPDFHLARDEAGRTIRFSRSERLLLVQLTRRRGHILSREALLDAVSGEGSEANDRNVDFLINRLRRKLRDPAREPAYIGTQYGEGYVWIAEETAPEASPVEALLVLGPLRGLDQEGEAGGARGRFVERLRARLDPHLGNSAPAAVAPDFRPAARSDGPERQYGAELSFHAGDDRLDCVVTLRALQSGAVVDISRVTLRDGAAATDREIDGVCEGLAARLADRLWADAAHPEALALPAGPPLPVRLHEASSLFVDARTASSAEAERRLRARLEEAPDDHQAQCLLATNIHSKYVQIGAIPDDRDFRAQDEAEMEALVLRSLPHVQDNPVYALAAAKLLYFLGRGYRELALDIAEDAFRSSTAVASSFSVYGQMRMFEGDLDEALALLDEGFALARGSGVFELYLGVIKMEALRAAGDAEALHAWLTSLYEVEPRLRLSVEPLAELPQGVEEAPEVAAYLDGLDEARARAVLRWDDYICSRLFVREEHRENSIRGPLMRLAARFGPGVVPREVARSVPRLAAEISGAADRRPRRAARK